MPKRKIAQSGWTTPPDNNPPPPFANPDLLSKIEAAFHEAGIKSDRIHEAAFNVLLFWGGPRVPTMPANVKEAAWLASLRHDQPANRVATEKELANLARAADRLLVAIQSLRWPALAAIGFNPGLQRMPPGFVWGRYPNPADEATDPGRSHVEGFHYDPSVLPWPGQQGPDAFTGLDLWVLQAQLSLLLASLEQQRIPENLPEKTGGAPVYAGRMRVGLLVARWFNELSGESFIEHIHQNNSLTEKRIFGRFEQLLSAVFQSLGIEASSGQTALDVRDVWASQRDRTVGRPSIHPTSGDKKNRKREKGRSAGNGGLTHENIDD